LILKFEFYSMISKEQISHIAKLAKLKLTVQEMDALQKDLGSVLNYVERLKAVDVDNVIPMSHCVEISNQVRPDLAKESNKEEQIIAQFPEREGRLNKVKAVFNHGSR